MFGSDPKRTLGPCRQPRFQNNFRPTPRTCRAIWRDNDRAFGYTFRSRLKAMGIRDRPTAPGCPWQNSYVERLIGTVRRECLDRVLILGEQDLRRVLAKLAGVENLRATLCVRP